MKFLQGNKIVIGIILLLVGVMYVYFTYFRNDPADELISSSTDTEQVSSELLVTLAKLHVIRLDDSIFTDPAFLSLTDFGVRIDPQNVGRRNPFAPLGSN